MAKKTTIYDIAKALNLTAATVSRALNRNPRISVETQNLVIATAKKMNYERNKVALALQSGKSNYVGVIVPHINRNFFSNIIQAIEDVLYPHGYHVIICQTYNDPTREALNIKALIDAQVEGILMSVTNIKDKQHPIFTVIDKKIPLIFFDKKINMDGVSSVTINDIEGAYLATKHLIEQGYKNIAHLACDLGLEIYRDRFSGYKKALKEYNVSYNRELVVEIQSNVHEGKIAMHRLLLDNPSIDAVFSSSDFCALGAIQHLKSIGKRIPEEFGVVGFSNEPFTEFMELPISTVEQHPHTIGHTAATVFLEQTQGRENIEKEVVIVPKLHCRKSSSRKI